MKNQSATPTQILPLSSEPAGNTKILPISTVQDNPSIFDPEKFRHMMFVAEVMSKGISTIPKHLQNKPSDCLAIVQQAERWGMDPFMLAQKTHLVNGVLGYEGQLVAAVIFSSAPLQGRLQYNWGSDHPENKWEKLYGHVNCNNGKWTKGWPDDAERGLYCEISATLLGEASPAKFRLYLTQAHIRNSPLWTQDPRQQLAYLAVKRFARLYFPDLILGVYSVDELDGQKMQAAIAQDKVPSIPEKKQSRLDELATNKKAIDVPDDQAGNDAHAINSALLNTKSSETDQTLSVNSGADDLLTLSIEDGQTADSLAAKIIAEINDIDTPDVLAKFWNDNKKALTLLKNKDNDSYVHCVNAKNARKKALGTE